MDGNALRTLIVTFAGNIFLAVLAVVALTFLFKREFTRFAEFILLAVLVATFIYSPQVWVNVARSVANALGA